MSDELTDDERRVRALTRTALELELAFRAAMFERDKMIVELYDTHRVSQYGLARALGRNWTRIQAIRRGWSTKPARWAKRKAEIEAELKALGDN